jgi:beta-lactamase class A
MKARRPTIMKTHSGRAAEIILVILAASGACLWLDACSSDAAHPAPDGGGGDASADGSSDGAGIATTATERALQWVLDAANGATLTEDEVNQRFSSTFLSQVPAAQLIQVFAEIGSMGPWRLERREPATVAGSLTAVVTRGDGQYWRLMIATDALGRIVGLLFLPAGELDPALDSWSAIDERAAKVAPQVNLLAATVSEDACVPIHALAADSSLAIGSSFKLWVLATLADQIRAGTHSWTETIPIVDAHKSLPSGVLQDAPAGTTLPLREFASQMISISDNTAADHLLFLVGREAVEAMLPITAHHAPALNQPFLSTRELFTLKLMATPVEQAAYGGATTAEKRALLAQHASVYDPRTYAGPDWTAPRLIEDLEWFASANDLCQVMRVLRNDGGQPPTAPVRGILSLNPGLPDASGAFDYIGFKGGSEPGVLNLTWLLQRNVDKQWVVVTLGFNDPEEEIDAAQAQYVATAARARAGNP